MAASLFKAPWRWRGGTDFVVFAADFVVYAAMAATCAAARGAFMLIFMFHLVQLHLQATSARDLPTRVLIHRSPSAPPSNPDVVNYWNSKLGNTRLPEAWTQNLVSRLSPEQVARFGQAIASPEPDSLNPSRDAEITSFCSTSGIICSSPDHSKGSALPTSSGFWQTLRDQIAVRTYVWHRLPQHEEEETESFSEAELALAREVFFVQETLPAPGAKAPGVLFSQGKSFETEAPAFLPRALVSALDKLEWTQLLHTLRVQQDSPLASAMASTSQRCLRYHGVIDNEVRSCSRSVEDVADFVSAHLVEEDGNPSLVRTATSGAVVSDQDSIATSFLEVVSVEPLGLASRVSVLCHRSFNPFPYMMQGCHSIQDTQLYSVMLRTSAGDGESHPDISVSNVVACHTSTSTFNPDFIAFRALGLKPGQHAICHWTAPGTTAFYSLP